MKGDKKILVVAVLLLLLAVSFSTYAIYRQSATGNGTIKAAAWSVKIDDTDIAEANFNFTTADITWTTHTGKNNTIAPGDTGTITIPVDATGSEVDVLLTATLGTIEGLPAGMTVTVSGTDGVTEIPYATSNMKENVTLTITWPGAVSDDSTKDGTDLAAKGKTLTIPVTLTARQKLATD